MLMIEPPPRSIIFGTVNRTKRSAALTLISIILSSISSATLPGNEIETLIFCSRLQRVAVLFQFQFGDRFQVDLIGAIGQSQCASRRPSRGEAKIAAYTRAAVRLNRAVDDPQRHVRRHDL